MKKKAIFILLSICVNLYSFDFPVAIEISDDIWITQFAPIGWSEDGKVAFMTYDLVDGRGGLIAKITIFDTVEDRVVWQQELDTFNSDLGKIDNSDSQFTSFFYSEDVQNALAVWAIKDNIGTPKELPFRYNGMNYHCVINTNFDYYNENYLGDPGISSFKVLVLRFDDSGEYLVGAQKTISEKRYNPASDWLLSVNSTYALISPFENRALFIYTQLERDFEDPQSYYYYSGAHLDYGYNDPLNTFLLRPYYYEP